MLHLCCDHDRIKKKPIGLDALLILCIFGTYGKQIQSGLVKLRSVGSRDQNAA